MLLKKNLIKVDRHYHPVACFAGIILMKTLATIAFIITLFAMGCTYETQDTRFGKIGTRFTSESSQEAPEPFVSKVSNTTDIHYSAKYCKECHVNVPPERGPQFLRYGGDYKRLCRCHYSTSESYIHPVDLEPSQVLMPRIPSELPLQDGKVTCATCHDIVVQCSDKPTERIFLKEEKFLRGAPYKNRTTICFKCHNITEYKKFNPHAQLNEKKQIIKERCLYCHDEIPDEQRATYEDIKLLGKPEMLCLGCHGRITVHQWHTRHIRKPPFEIEQRIQELRDQYDIILPLDPDGKITCSTCHNPHQKGVIPDKRLGARGAGEKFRHRLKDNMCVRCHPMQDLSPYPELL